MFFCLSVKVMIESGKVIEMGILTKCQLREVIKEKKLITADDVQEMVKAALDTELGYPKNGTVPEGSANRRNGHSHKQICSQYGELNLSVPGTARRILNRLW